MLGGWQQRPADAGLLARACAIAAARVHLESGHDVVVPQYVGRPEFLRQLDELARDTGAAFVEIVLLDTRENSLARFARRTRAVARPEHAEAQALLDCTGGAAELGAMYDRLVELLRHRPKAQIVRTDDGDVAGTYRRVAGVIVGSPA